MKIRSHIALGMLACGISGAAQAYQIDTATYSAGFTLAPPGLRVLHSDYAGLGDQNEPLPGRWISSNGQNAETYTTDLASYEINPYTGEVELTWGAYGYDDNRGIGGMPGALGGTFAFGCGSSGGGCATGSHTDSSASVSGNHLGARVTLTDLYARADTQASWAGRFSLDPYSSFTFSGYGTVSITGDPAPMQSVTKFDNYGDSYASFSSVTLGDALGRARLFFGASVWGENSALGDFSYSIGPDNLLAVTVTNNSNAALLGRIDVGAYINLSPPIPEPETWLMLLAGAGLVRAAAWKRPGRLTAAA